MAETKIHLFLMFEGKAEEAMNFYIALFPGAQMIEAARKATGELKIARFTLAGQAFYCANSSEHHDFTFTPSMSIMVDCDSEEEITRLYGALLADGSVVMELGSYGHSQRFGWVNDRFGVSWQLNLP